MPQKYRNEKMFHEAGWQSLADAIVELAARDLMNTYAINKNKKNREAIVRNNSDYRFFCSQWFCMLSSIDGNAILEGIRRRTWGD